MTRTHVPLYEMNDQTFGRPLDYQTGKNPCGEIELYTFDPIAKHDEIMESELEAFGPHQNALGVLCGELRQLQEKHYAKRDGGDRMYFLHAGALYVCRRRWVQPEYRPVAITWGTSASTTPSYLCFDSTTSTNAAYYSFSTYT